MLTRDEFRKYVRTYIDYTEYEDELANVGVNIWERPEIGALGDCYVKMLCMLMNVKEYKGFCNELEDFLFNPYMKQISDKDIDNLYNELVDSEFYILDDDNITISTGDNIDNNINVSTDDIIKKAVTKEDLEKHTDFEHFFSDLMDEIFGA